MGFLLFLVLVAFVTAVALILGARARLDVAESDIKELRDRQRLLELRIAKMKEAAGKAPVEPARAPEASGTIGAPGTTGAPGFSFESEEGILRDAAEQVAAEGPSRAGFPSSMDAPPVAFPLIPHSPAPADIHLSKQIQLDSAAPAPPGGDVPQASGTRTSSFSSSIPPSPSSPSSPPPSPAQPQARPPAPPRPPIDWEGFVGVKLFSWAAAVLLALAGAFFFKYSIDHGWLTPPLRMVMGLLAGVGLLVGCELKAARRYSVTANALDAAGVSLLFGTFFAAHSIWHLIGSVTAFLLMALVTAIAVALALRRDSVFIALLGLIGGFATPALLSTGEDRPFGLFGYLLLLNAGLAWVAYKKRWAFLSILSLVFTTFYQWGWVVKFLSEGKLPLATAIFLVFPALSLGALALSRKADDESGGEFERTAAAGAVLPLLFAFFLAGVPAYAAHPNLLFGFLLLVDVGLAVLAAVRRLPALHAAAAFSTLAIFGVWCATQHGRIPLGPTLAFLAAFVLFYLLAPWVAARAGKPLEGVAEQAGIASPLLLFVFVVLASSPEAADDAFLVFGALLALVLAVASVALPAGRIAPHAIGGAFAFAAQLAWAAKHLGPETALPSFSIFAVFGLFYLAAPALALARPAVSGASREALRGSLYLGLMGQVLLFVSVYSKGVSLPPAPWLGVLALLLAGAGVAAIASEAGGLLVLALAASHAVVALWVVSAGEAAPGPFTAILAAAAIAAWGVVCFLIAKKERRFVVAAATGLLLGSLVVVLASFAKGSPPAHVHAAVQLGFLAVLLAVAAASRAHVLAVLGTVPASLAAFSWDLDGHGSASWKDRLLIAGPLYLLLVAYPLALGRRAGKSREPYLAAVLMSVSFFLLARHELLVGGFADRIGLLPVAQAALMALLLVRLRTLDVPAAEDTGRLALVAGTLLAFITVAVPLQLEKEWITIGWAILGAGLAWLFGRLPHRGLLAWSLGLLAAVFIRLALNPAVLTYHERASTPIVNWYLYTYLVSGAAFFAAARFLRGVAPAAGGPFGRVVAVLTSAGTLLLFLLLNLEIADFFSTGTTPAFNAFSARFGEGLTYTLAWAVFAIGLLVAGLIGRSRPARIAAVVLLGVTILKCFLSDLARLGGLYRVASLVGLAVCLVLVALLVQKFVLARERPAS